MLLFNLSLNQIEPINDIARVKAMLKETFTAFNAAIERAYTNQSGWTIPDHMLRGAVKRVIKDDLLRPYQDFMRQYVKLQCGDIASHLAQHMLGLHLGHLLLTACVSMSQKFLLSAIHVDAFRNDASRNSSMCWQYRAVGYLMLHDATCYLTHLTVS
jgi:hypothetical protein